MTTHRLTTTRPALEALARRTGTSVPWRAGDVPGEEATSAPDDPDVAAAMQVLHAPAVLVDVDVSVRRGAGWAQVRSWHRWRAGRVTAVSTAGGDVELAWFTDDAWPAELARAADVTVPRRPVEPPEDDLRLPHDVLVAAGEAVQQDRHDLLAELATRAGLAPDPLRRLHTAALGRLRAVVAGGSPTGTRRAGWVSWVLFADGWRALTPYVEGGGAGGSTAMVRVTGVPPARLGVEVARLVTQVRA